MLVPDRVSQVETAVRQSSRAHPLEHDDPMHFGLTWAASRMSFDYLAVRGGHACVSRRLRPFDPLRIRCGIPPFNVGYSLFKVANLLRRKECPRLDVV